MSIDVTVKTGGLLFEYLPRERTGNRARLSLGDATTVSALMRQLGLPAATYLVIVNGALVPESARDTHALADGDEISINPPLKGG